MNNQLYLPTDGMAMNFMATDLETTGPEPAEAHVIEWATVSFTPGEIGETMTRFVKPPVPIPPETSAVHHIISEDVGGAEPWDVESTSLGNRLVQADALVAHNADFEKHFLAALAPDVPWICTYKCALRAWPEAPRHSNEALRYWLELGDDRGRAAKQNPHSALHDALVTARILLKLLEFHSVATLLQWSTEGAILPRCPIGKYRGAAWADVDFGYLEWIVYKAIDMRADVLNSANLEIDRRLNPEPAEASSTDKEVADAESAA